MTRLNPHLRLFAQLGIKALPLTLIAGLLAGCMAPSPYAPRLEGNQTGYTDRALTQNRYRVTFTGNTVTPRETVESFLLLRAAEVTRAAGYTNFVFDTRNTRTNTSVQTVPYGPPPDPFWGGYYGRRGLGGFGGWGGWGFAYEPAVDVVVRTNFEAYAEIVLLTPDQAAKEPRSLNAADVITHVGPDATPPKPNQT
ncbi:MAG: hypothetical protein H0U98_06895 [Alphaproteobacteria bacterium]|nr:hypothetical protein [Alphaproteobacteria bacterium]